MIPSENHILPEFLIWQPGFFKCNPIFLSFLNNHKIPAKTQHKYQLCITVTCFDSKESSSGYL